MDYKVEHSAAASRDLDGITHYITYTLKNPAAADNLLKDYAAKLDNMRKNPRIYPLPHIKRFADKGYRKIGFGNYIAFFTVDEAKYKVYIIRILYQKQDYMNFL